MQLATVRNMRKFEGEPGVFAYSPVTQEKYSATPGDYFWMPCDEPLTDEDGAPLLLAVENVEIREL
jgi:hypothetical protein